VQLSLLAIPFAVEVGDHELHFHKFMLDQAIKMTKEAGVKYFSIKDTHLPLKAAGRSVRKHGKRWKMPASF